MPWPGHQVDFLDKQVALAQEHVLQASKILLDFQNQKGLASPKATAESIYAIIAKLEGPAHGIADAAGFIAPQSGP